jgi:hypothetical protein
MQNKLIAAAAVATGAKAMRLTTNTLAQVSHDEPTVLHHDHQHGQQYGHGAPYGGICDGHGYDYSYDPYECLQGKVDGILAKLTQGVADHKAECMVTADDLRA